MPKTNNEGLPAPQYFVDNSPLTCVLALALERYQQLADEAAPDVARLVRAEKSFSLFGYEINRLTATLAESA